MQARRSGASRPAPPAGDQVLRQYYGPRDELAALIEPLARVRAPTQRQLATVPFLEAALNWALCGGATVAECRLPSQNPHGIVPRTAYRNKSSYVTEPLTGRAIEVAIAWMERHATAFVHRDDLYHAQFIAHWTPDDSPRVARAAQQWVRRFYADMRPFMSSFAYQDYIDPELRDWRHAYYGSNYRRLVRIKHRWDPDNVFHFAQSIGA